MCKINEYRIKIDEIDNKIMQLLEARFNNTEEIMRIKKKKGLNKLDKGREDIILLKAKSHGEEVYDIYNYILKISKEGVVKE